MAERTGPTRIPGRDGPGFVRPGIRAGRRCDLFQPTKGEFKTELGSAPTGSKARAAPGSSGCTRGPRRPRVRGSEAGSGPQIPAGSGSGRLAGVGRRYCCRGCGQSRWPAFSRSRAARTAFRRFDRRQIECTSQRNKSGARAVSTFPRRSECARSELPACVCASETRSERVTERACAPQRSRPVHSSFSFPPPPPPPGDSRCIHTHSQAGLCKQLGSRVVQ